MYTLAKFRALMAFISCVRHIHASRRSKHAMRWEWIKVQRKHDTANLSFKIIFRFDHKRVIKTPSTCCDTVQSNGLGLVHTYARMPSWFFLSLRNVDAGMDISLLLLSSGVWLHSLVSIAFGSSPCELSENASPVADARTFLHVPIILHLMTDRQPQSRFASLSAKWQWNWLGGALKVNFVLTNTSVVPKSVQVYRRYTITEIRRCRARVHGRLWVHGNRH